MALNYANPTIREQIIQEINQKENIDRKAISLGQFEIYSDRIKTQVENYLKGFYSEKTVKEMPIVSTINLAKRIANQEGAIYDNAPVRTFEGVSDEQKAALEKLYKDLGVNQLFQKANRMFKLQDQIHIQLTLGNRKLKPKVLMAHQLDVVPSPFDPEEADAYIVNGFDRSMYSPDIVSEVDSQNQLIADQDDYKANTKRMALWSDQFNFVMDKDGNILSPDPMNPIKIKPFVEVSRIKDGEYWFRTGAALTDFTIQFCAALSDLAQIIRVQGFGQAFIKGLESMIPTEVIVGPSRIIKLPIDPNSNVTTEFGFANPSPDLAGSLQFIEMVLSAFLTSRGLDPSTVNGKAAAEKFSSGLDRLLSLIDDFKPARDDFDLFEKAERDFFNILKVYLNTYGGSEFLPDLNIGQIPEKATVTVKYAGPELIMTESDKIDLGMKKIESGFFGIIETIMDVRGVSREQAEQIYKENQAVGLIEKPETDQEDQQESKDDSAENGSES
jgi:hypothetical protein